MNPLADPAPVFTWPQGADEDRIAGFANAVELVAARLAPDATASMVAIERPMVGQQVTEIDAPAEALADWRRLAPQILAAAWPNNPACGGEVALRHDATMDLVLAFPDAVAVQWEQPLASRWASRAIEVLQRANAASAEMVITDRIAGSPPVGDDMYVRVTMRGRADRPGLVTPGWPDRPEPGTPGLGVLLSETPDGSIASMAAELVMLADDPFVIHPDLRTRLVILRDTSDGIRLQCCLDSPYGAAPTMSWTLPPPHRTVH